MKKIMFVCHGNICRSPLAEFLFNYLAEKRGVSNLFCASSSGTSSEEQGNPVHYMIAPRLKKLGIDCSLKRARKITKQDYDNFDMIVCMEKYNENNLKRVIGEDVLNKVSLLLDYTGECRDVIDPYYYGNYDGVWDDIFRGCTALLDYLLKKDS